MERKVQGLFLHKRLTTKELFGARNELSLSRGCRQNIHCYLLTWMFLFLLVQGCDCQCKLFDINQLKGLLWLENQLVVIDSSYKLFDLKDVYQDRLHFYSVTK